MKRSAVAFQLGWKGRLNRLSYLFAVLIFYGGTFIAFTPTILLEKLLESENRLLDITPLPSLVLLWIVFTSTIRRLHDLNKSGGWIPVIGCRFIAASIGSRLSIEHATDETLMVLAILHYFGTFTFGFGLIALFFIPGTKGENKFGADPRNEKPIDVLLGKFHRNNKGRVNTPKQEEGA